MEHELAELELNKNWDRIFNLLNDGLMIVKPNGMIYHINRAMENVLGYNRSEMIGKPCLMLKCDACETLVSGTRDTWCSLFDEGKDLQKDCMMVKRDGSYFLEMENRFRIFLRSWPTNEKPHKRQD